MKTTTLTFATLAASSLAVAVLVNRFGELPPAEAPANAVTAPQPAPAPYKRTRLTPKPLAERVFPPPDSAPAEEPSELEPADTAKKKIVMHFRGDWGETPTYSKNDRVNYRRGAYLSLRSSNRNNPPDISPDFWKLLKQGEDIDQEACARPGPGAKLTECDFSGGLSLNGLDLSGADLSKARLNGELGSANLSGANLSGAAVLEKLVIGPETRIDHANLSGLQSGGNNPLIAEKADLTGTNFSKADLNGANLSGATLADAKLNGALLTGANLADAKFEGADLGKTDLSFANLKAGVLDRAQLGGADLTQADLSQARFADAAMGGANLAGANLSGADFSGADLRGANFAEAQGADSAHVDRRTDFTGATCPDGVTADGVQVTSCVGHGF